MAARWQPTKTGVPQGGVASPLWSNIYLTPFDHAMTKAGYRLTRWADDFVVVCRTRQEAEAALARQKRSCARSSGSACIRKRPGSSMSTTGSSSSATRSSGAKGCGCPRDKRTARTNPLNLYAVPREKSVHRFKDQIRNLTRRRAPVGPAGHDRGHQPDHPRLGELLPKGECPKTVPSDWMAGSNVGYGRSSPSNGGTRRGDNIRLPRLVNEFGLVRLIHLVPGINPSSSPKWRPHRKAACGKTARAV